MKKIIFPIIILLFINMGYTQTPISDQEPKCYNNVMLYINGKYQCIDTFPLYYPLQWDHDELEDLFNLHRSSIMKILGEEKWYGTNTKEDRIRMLFIEYAPTFDSVKLYTFADLNEDSIILTKKWLPTYDYPGLWGVEDTIYYYGDTIIVEPKKNDTTTIIDTINFLETNYIVTQKELKKLFKYLEKSMNCNTLPLYNYSFPPSYYIEYSLKGKYYLHRIGELNNIARRKKCAPALFKIINWFAKY